MRARARLYRAGAAISAAAMGAAGLALVPAAAQAAPQAAASSQPVNHYNVGATHSPELLAQLAAGGQSLPLRAGAMTRAGLNAATPVGGEPGVDVASYQHPITKKYPQGTPIDWNAVAQSGVKFVAIKATEGNYYENDVNGKTKKDWAVIDLQQAQKAGLSTMAYAFGIPNQTTGTDATAAGQADYLLNYLAPGGTPAVSPLPPIMLDIEYNPYGSECYGLSQSSMLAWIQDFENEIIAKTTRPAIIYSTEGWLDTCVGPQVANLAQYPLWIAAYTGTTSPGMLPNGFSDWGMWQYTSGGTVPGIPTRGATDLDVFSPDSVLVPGQLMLFNPGDQQAVAGSGNVSVTVNAYPEEPSPGTLTFSSSSVPPNLSLTPSTGVISGPAPAADVALGPITVSVQDSNPNTSGSHSVTFSWYTHGTLTLSAPQPTTVAGSPVDLDLAAGMTDSTANGAPVTFQAANLPPGLSMTPAGLVTGWPDAPGIYHVRVRASDSLQAPAYETVTWTVKPAPNSGPTGAFRLDLSGKCLNDYRNRTRNGNPVNLWKCNGSAAQRWTYASDFTVRFRGKCLTAPASAGGPVVLESCQSLGSQVWRLTSPRSVNASAGATPLGFVNFPSGLCLSDNGTRTANGNPIVATTCDGQRDQAWTLPSGTVGSQLPGLCLDDSNGRTANGNPIDVWRCGGTARMRWTVGVDGTLRVDGKCLDVRRSRTRAGTPLELWKCNGTSAQQWRLIPDGNGLDLVNPHSHKCVTDPGNNTRRGTRLRIESCAQTPGQRWHVL